MARIIRLFATILAAGAFTAAATAQDNDATAETVTTEPVVQAQAIVSDTGTRVLAVLNNDDMPVAQKRTELFDIFADIIDVPYVSAYVLGQYRRLDRNPFYNDQAALDADLDEFRTVFKDYVLGRYVSQLIEYRGETFEIISARERSANDFIITMTVDGGADNADFDVDWRLLNRKDQIRVIDVVVYDIKLLDSQREETIGLIRAARGDISAAAQAFRREVEAANALTQDDLAPVEVADATETDAT